MATGNSWLQSGRTAKNILQWNGQDCLRWVMQVCGECCLDPSVCDERRLLQLTGPQLLSLSTTELELCVGAAAASVCRQRLDGALRLRGEGQNRKASKGQGKQTMHCGGGFGLPSFGEPPLPVPHSPYPSELCAPMAAMAGSWDPPAGYTATQLQSSPASYHSREHQAFACPDSLTTSSYYEVEEERYQSLPVATVDYGSSFLSLPTQELPQLDLLTVADVLNDRDDADGFDCGPYDKTGSEGPQPLCLAQPSKFGAAHPERHSRRSRSAIRDPPLCVSTEHLESGRWFEPYRVERDRLRRPEVWEYILRLLQDPCTEGELVEWVDRDRGVFRIVQRQQVARMWRDHWHQSKRGTPLNYENFAKNLSYHYSTGVLVRVPEQSTYQLGHEVLRKLNEGHRW